MRIAVAAKLAVILSLASALLLAGCERQERRQALDLLRRARVAEQTVSLHGEVQTEITRPEGPVLARAQIQRTPERTVVKFTEGPAAGKEMVTEHARSRPPGSGRNAPRAVSGMEQVPPVETVAQRYDVELGEAATIADRPVRQVTIQPRKGSSRQSVSLWIDEETGFPLARERRDASGHRVYATRYLQVNYDRVPSAPPPPRPAPQVAPTTPAVPSPAPGAPGSSSTPAPGAGPPPSAPPRTSPEAGTAPPAQPPFAKPPSSSPDCRERRRGWAQLPGGPYMGPRADTGKGGYRRQVVSLAELGQALGFIVTPPTFVPEGFVLRRIWFIKQAQLGPRGVLHFSDRVTALTVMVGRRQDLFMHEFPEQAAQPGGAAIVRRPRVTVAVAVRGEAVYIVFGPLPDNSLERIAASIP